MSLRVLSVFGTRPEAIKMAPILKVMEEDPEIDSQVCITCQHREMLMPVLDLFSIKTDFNLDVMQSNQSLTELVARILQGLQKVIDTCRPQVILVHGDTSSCFAGALAAFYNQIPIVHIEAGLRTGKLNAPFPEEAHRQLLGRIANLHMAPSQQAAEHLFIENVVPDTVYVTGNTIVDALRLAQERFSNLPDSFFQEQLGVDLFEHLNKTDAQVVLITLHRREVSEITFARLCDAIATIARQHPDCLFIYPVHLNPRVQEPAYQLLNGVSNVYLLPPQDYLTFNFLLVRSDLIVTDSGGVQEEAGILGKAVLIVRDHTDRPEMLLRPGVELVGTQPDRLVERMSVLLPQARYISASSSGSLFETSLYGDGFAAQKIINIVKQKYIISIPSVSAMEYELNPV